MQTTEVGDDCTSYEICSTLIRIHTPISKFAVYSDRLQLFGH